MKTELQLLNKTLELKRYPEHLQHHSWQAWDSADEYLIEHLEELALDTAGKNLIIFNDDCGALATWFAQGDWNNIDWVSDSFVSTQCALKNLSANECEPSAINCLDSLAEFTQRPDLVLIKIPKTTALLQHQLIQLQKVVSSDTQIIAAGKAKNIHKSTLALFEKYLGETKTSLAKKKSRLIFTTPTGDKHDTTPYPTVWKIEEPALTISNHANVFSRHQLDLGGRFFIKNLPNCEGKTMIDLGCGNGLIGLAVLKNSKYNKVIFVDESYMAVASAKLNVEQNFSERMDDCTFLVSNCLDEFDLTDPSTSLGEQDHQRTSHPSLPSGVEGRQVDIVLCNPPFHQSHGITDHVALQMFTDAQRVLKKGGELRIIGNRHLSYHQKLKEMFGDYKVVGSNKKFSVLSCKK